MMGKGETTQSINPSLLHRIFMGKQGLRAGWSIGIFFVSVSLLTAGFILPAKYILEIIGLPLVDEQPLSASIGEFFAFLGLLAASMMMAFIEHQPLISYGLEGSHRLKSFFYGGLSGLTALSVLICILTFSGFLVFDGQPIFDWNAMYYAVAWGVAFFLVGLYEEYFFRGYLQSTLSRGIGFWWSALFLSCAFGSIHFFNKGESPVGIFSAALVGMVFCVSLWYLKQLWWAIGFHASWNWSQSYLWGTANSGKNVEGHLFSVHPQGNILLSGGATGPEGSVLVIPLLLFIALLMWLVWKRISLRQKNILGAGRTSLR